MTAKIVVLCGGVGAAKFLRGLAEVVDGTDVMGIVNTADDLRMHGLAISPDLDTCTYTLADEINPETGWGLANETWQAMETLQRLGGESWFNLGDRDLGTHMYRTARLRQGAPLSTVTAEITSAFGLSCALVPMSDDEVRTRVTTTSHGELSFQEYFVKHRHALTVTAIDIVGAESAAAGPGVVAAIEGAEHIIIAPSNPIVSIRPILAVPAIDEALSGRREAVSAISPIVGGKALKGPADRLMTELGYDASAVGVAEIYQRYAARLLIDDVDADQARAVGRTGMEVEVTDTIMSDVARAADLARRVIGQA